PLLADALERNICTLIELRREADSHKGTQERMADAITTFSGSMTFVYLHAVLFAVWILWNTGTLHLKVVDPFPFNFLTMVVSLEAIFLSTFVMVSQNRMQDQADERADLDLQINMLSEYEITRMLRLIDAMAEKMGIEEADDPELDELKTDVMPETVLRE